MEKIIQINYQGRTISIEENAYNAFQQYETNLKTFFLKEDGGEETFADLQYRMAEILEQKNASTSNAVTLDDINELINMIGKPSDLDAEQTSSQENTSQQTPPQKKKLNRNKNKNEKVIAGVCSGIAHYFSIDPIAVRLMFVLFTIFNIATLFKFNVGILGYIVLWVLLEPAYIKTNIHRKLFRNPKDKVLGGVCSGLAQFFNSETWIVRLIFVAPFIMGIIADHSIINHDVSSFFYTVSFVSYVLLWVIVPVAKSSTDYMLLKGEPINISTIQNPQSMSLITEHSKSGINKFLKVIAYIILAFFLMFMIPIAISILVASVFSFNVADIVLFTSFNKTLALFTIMFLVALPVVGVIIWLIRKIAGYNKPNRPLRVIFVCLHILGWVSAGLLVASLGKDNNTYISKQVTENLPINSDTLYVSPLINDSSYTENVVFKFNQFDHLFERTADENNIKAVRLKYKKTDDSVFSVVIERTAFGRNTTIAGENAMLAVYETRIEGNTLYLPSMLSVSNKTPYHFQNIMVTIYVPATKTLIVAEKLKRQLRQSIWINNRNFNVHEESDGVGGNDDVITFRKGEGSETSIIGDSEIEIDEAADDDTKRKAKEIIRDARQTAEEQINEANRALDVSTREAQQQIEETQRELEQSRRDAKQKIDEAKRELELSKREAKQQIEDAKRSTSK